MKTWFTPHSFLMLALCVVFAQGAFAQEEETNDEETVQQKISTNVETLQLTARQLEVRNSYVGHLVPSERVVIRAETEGTIEKVYADEGQLVEKGENLVNISTERLSLNMKLAKANYELAESEYKTEQLLFNRQVSTSSKLDQVRTNRDVKSINFELSQLEFEKSKVKSPLTGVVKSRHVEVGTFVNRGQNLFEVMDIAEILASINIPEREMRFAGVGKPVQVRIDAIPGAVFMGKVKTLSLEADLKNRSFPAEIALANPQRQLLPGMMARVEMITMAAPSEIIIPRYAVLERENSRIVFIENNGVALEREVLLGTIIKDEVQVISGLQRGDRLIITGQYFLTNEEKVNVVKNIPQSAQSF